MTTIDTMAADASKRVFYIASIKHTGTHDEHITFWGKNHCGYTPVVGDHIGEYELSDAVRLNDGLDHIAVPVEFVKSIASPEPYWKPGARFYDQRGPVVDNTRAIWNQLLKASLPDGRKFSKQKISVHRGARRSFGWTDAGVTP